ncbi:hypothetical protein jhhlp_005167 [Lomentospora prolificans]|uniref:Peroxisomal membrane protein PEX13 n=1 Tax=Lomentospora prolificans TaxID=41688 RepID=A0A2N3N710_9PEZI|nr:hypothetical protein jhhlp_005167 [Lomentospora prolificans]
MASPPKPWEMSGTTTPLASVPSADPSMSTSQTTAAAASGAPQLPERPSSLASAVNQNAAAYSRMGMGMGASPYGTYGSAYQSPYSSPYSGMGAYGGYGGGMYGGGYGGYGGYGRGMYGGGMYGGMPGNPNDPNSLTNSFNQSTAATFQMLEGIVGAFGGFAQMLESTYMATHSSFYAMISVAEQFGNLRETLGSILGIFAIMRWIRTLIAKLTGRPPPADATALTPAAFAKFEGRAGPNGASAGPPKASRKPLLFFIAAAFGLPYLMSKLIRTLAASQEEEQKRLAANEQQMRIDPSQLEYCRVLYDYAPQTQAGAANGVDLEVKKGDLVAVLAKTDPFGAPSEWWKCRTRDARMGYLPSTYLEVVRRPGEVKAAKPVAAIKATPASDSSRTNSLTSSGETVSSIQSPPTPTGVPRPLITSKQGPLLTAEDFQKSQFY